MFSDRNWVLHSTEAEGVRGDDSRAVATGQVHHAVVKVELDGLGAGRSVGTTRDVLDLDAEGGLRAAAAVFCHDVVTGARELVGQAVEGDIVGIAVSSALGRAEVSTGKHSTVALAVQRDELP